MGKIETVCNIYSMNKQWQGTEGGTLLRVKLDSKALCFDGLRSGNDTNFIKTARESDKTSTFHIKISDTLYYVSKQKNGICLKSRKDSTCIFEVHSLPFNDWVSIRAKKSGKFLTTDDHGQTSFTTIRSISNPPTGAIYSIESPHDVNNNDYSSDNTFFESSV